MTNIPGVAYEIKNDIILIEQDDGCGEVSRVAIHKIHFEHITSKLGLPTLTVTVEGVRRKLQVVFDRLESLAEAKHYRTEIIERCGSGIEFIIELDAVCDLASEFLKDINESFGDNLID